MSSGLPFEQQAWFTNVESNDPMEPTQRSVSVPYDEDEDEIPLLEELGISFADIWTKTKLVLRPSISEIDDRIVEEADLAGPIVFGLCLGGLLLLRGKVHFGYIYGFGISSCVGTYLMLNLMASPDTGVGFSHVVSFLGYCLLPVVVLAAVALVIKLTGPLGTVLAALCVFASTWTSTRLFETKLHARHQRFLIAYPLALIYCCFVLITIF
ncbi:hypothetical protein CTAYLR_002714 [Chrysophaeum taylorii]|uniref:Protein YIPF n=1 Tax=Chrysophaeum taylorii TaxID=2483200 RepID=A0AAD7UCJ1_9STRA|nr:hypothetical protein CTAYLR_002714 [Chrysophaeum taylorii]